MILPELPLRVPIESEEPVGQRPAILVREDSSGGGWCAMTTRARDRQDHEEDDFSIGENWEEKTRRGERSSAPTQCNEAPDIEVRSTNSRRFSSFAPSKLNKRLPIHTCPFRFEANATLELKFERVFERHDDALSRFRARRASESVREILQEVQTRCKIARRNGMCSRRNPLHDATSQGKEGRRRRKEERGKICDYPRSKTFGRGAFRGRIKCNDVTLLFPVTCTVLSLSCIAWYVCR